MGVVRQLLLILCFFFKLCTRSIRRRYRVPCFAHTLRALCTCRCCYCAAQGTVVAVDMSIGSFTRMVAPALTSWLLARQGFWSIGAVASALVGVVPLLVLVRVCVFVRVERRELRNKMRLPPPPLLNDQFMYPGALRCCCASSNQKITSPPTLFVVHMSCACRAKS